MYQIAMLDDAVGNLSEFDRDLRETLRLDPTYEAAYFDLANLYVRLGEAAKAKAVVEEAMKLEPKYAPLYFLYSGLLKREGRIKDAVRAIEAGLELDPKNADGYFDEGYLLAALGRYREAIYMLNGFVARTKESNPTRAKLARGLIDKLMTEIDRQKNDEGPALKLF
jgi:Tfp pilus assembly protein PilF